MNPNPNPTPHQVEREDLRRKCATSRCFDEDDDWDDEPDWEVRSSSK